ncbi:hypothetical protein [Sandarakinorhabdus sp. DWP1-3-1]|uniref:hypothetical protein n=1 Tax=Sandarakinorhabdus sp. DWP1-3-1 TaxID=2804627 RepID=UPI003CF8A558
MTRAVTAGLAYFVAVFAIGFALGALRVDIVAPRLGALAAVMLEVPVMLALAWPICGALIRRHRVPHGLAPRLAMGATAFGILMLAETVLGAMLFGQDLATQAAHLGTAAGLAGLAGQVLFAALPLLHRG